MRPAMKGVSLPIPENTKCITKEELSNQISALIVARRDFRERKRLEQGMEVGKDKRQGRNDTRKDNQDKDADKMQKSKGCPRIIVCHQGCH